MISVSSVSADQAAALAPLRGLAATVAALLPSGEAIPPGDKESARQGALLRCAEHLLGLPVGRPAGDELLRRGAALRQKAADTLALLGQHVVVALPEALSRAAAHWEQAGHVTLLSSEGRHAALALQAAVQEALDALQVERVRTPYAVAFLSAAAEAMTAVDSACTLLRALEVRFTSLLRERLRQQEAAAPPKTPREALLPGGAPFLPVGEALLAAAGALGWSDPSARRPAP